MVEGYSHALIILAHLSMIWASGKVRVEKIPEPDGAPAPDECYVLKSNGESDFQWLPTSGMSHEAAS